MLNDIELLNYIQEDVPHVDFTTHLQEGTERPARLEIFTRHEVVVSGVEDAARIAQLLHCQPVVLKPSRSRANPQDVILQIDGRYADIHCAWKLAQIFLEYTCGISTYTNKMLSAAREVNSNCQILGTRKTFPLAKKICIQSLLDGGGMPHRLNLSDSVLFFNQHRALYKNNNEFYKKIESFKVKSPEKKIAIETNSYADAIELMKFGADVIQLDKMEIASIEKIVDFRIKNFPPVKVISAGGINLANVKEHARCMVDAIVTSAVYVQGLADISSRIIL